MVELTAEKQERKTQVYEKKARLLTVAYLVFQATAFFSITKQACSSGQCHSLFWLPFVLSMLSSLIYFLALLEILSGFFWARFQLELSFGEQGTGNKEIREAESSIPYLKNPSLNPQFRVYFSKEWYEALRLSLRNFFSEIFNVTHILYN
ncbi:hypothetical protein V6N11_011769 [Hibiscus sabdariffa]|uniref:ARMC9 CTLH-like domain-containing protein n=1 Tax=Hibiscus sabdariffa TaxID=183260 RepID=A0ABR2S9L7_9ROSI